MKEVEIKVYPDKIDNIDHLKDKCKKKLRINQDQEITIQVVRKSIDARFKRPFFLLRVKVFFGSQPEAKNYSLNIPRIENRKKVLIIGAGPAGYFAALKCLSLGLIPIVFDRGKNVRDRRRDLRAIQQYGEVNPNSNYCFGEGGAGTYSDGKLYTRSHKRGSIAEILNILVFHGAKTDILIDTHPHIGSNKLPGIIANIRDSIECNGGSVHFNHKVIDLILEKKKIIGIKTQDEKDHFGEAVILATGHSARDIYYLLAEKKIRLESKDFALGVRIEHPQQLIDKIQYNQIVREKNLPAASYKLVCQVEGNGVFSFCMCPGGLIVPAATSPGEIVVNGMSLSKRDSPFANSGFVTQVSSSMISRLGYKGVFGNLYFQRNVEQELFKFGDGSQKAPTLRMTDFVNKKLSTNLNKSSYIPGVYPAPLYDLLPNIIYDRIGKALKMLDKRIKGFYTEEANVVATESRTSSPIRIPRNKDTFMHPEIQGLFPCGEGAGYAGGILSAAMDGQNVSKAVHSYLNQ